MNNHKHFDFAIIGGGIIGSSLFYKLSQKHPNSRVILLEKESMPARHQSGRNSGVIHSGLYYKPGSIKAKTCINGYNQLVNFCKEYNIKHEICGKIVVAKNVNELDNLARLNSRGIENGLKGIETLDEKGIKEFEPNIKGVKGLYVPQTGIVDYIGMANKFIDLALHYKNYDIKYDFNVVDIKEENNSVKISSLNDVIFSDRLICCGGLFSDILAIKTNKKIDIKIVPFRGDYYELKPSATHLINNLVYPVPDPDLPFLGVHFTRMYDGRVECGPNAVFSFKREGYNKFDFSLSDSLDSLSYIGTWKLFLSHFMYGIGEYSRAISKNLFLKSLQELLPNLKNSDIVPGRSGIRAQALDKNGKLLDDFKIISSKNIVNVINAPSPGATASMAISDYIINNHDL